LGGIRWHSTEPDSFFKFLKEKGNLFGVSENAAKILFAGGVSKRRKKMNYLGVRKVVRKRENGEILRRGEMGFISWERQKESRRAFSRRGRWG